MASMKVFAVVLIICGLAFTAFLVIQSSPRGSQTPTSTEELQPQPRDATPAAPATRTSAPVRFRPTHQTRQLQVLEGPYFTVGYDNARKNPAWVVYQLDGPIVHRDRSPDRPTFATDFRTSAHVAHRDYTHSGFDRGHMAPAFAMWSRHGRDAFLASFSCSNIVPQYHEMNAEIWEDLEDDVAGGHRQGDGWAGSLRNITVINGPVYEGKLETLKTGISVPTACFSIVLDWQEDGPGYKALAFQIPNTKTVKGPLGRWLTTIKAIEQATGLDVFAGEAATLRIALESQRAATVWPTP
jgi:endonuclease G